MSRRPGLRTLVPPYIREKMASYALHVATGGPEGWTATFLDLATGHATLRSDRGTAEIQVDPDTLATLRTLAEETWAAVPPRWSHPHTVAGGEHLAIVDGDAGCFEEVDAGNFSNGPANDLVEWATRACRENIAR